jgi:hypothetical protein
MRTQSDRPACCAAQSTTRVVRLRARRIASTMTTAGECGASRAAARRHSSPLGARASSAHRRVITAGGDETTIGGPGQLLEVWWRRILDCEQHRDHCTRRRLARLQGGASRTRTRRWIAVCGRCLPVLPQQRAGLWIPELHRTIIGARGDRGAAGTPDDSRGAGVISSHVDIGLKPIRCDLSGCLL